MLYSLAPIARYFEPILKTITLIGKRISFFPDVLSFGKHITQTRALLRLNIGTAEFQARSQSRLCDIQSSSVHDLERDIAFIQQV